jgi:hypothetical protein
LAAFSNNKFKNEGRDGNCRRLRAAWPPETSKAMKRVKMKKQLNPAILLNFKGLEDNDLDKYAS